MQKTHDNVGDLDAGVIDVVLHLDAIFCGFQDAHKSVAQHGVTHVTNVGSFVGIDARMLDHLLWSIFGLSGSCLSWTSEQAEQLGAIEEDVDITCAGDLGVRDFVDVFELGFEFLCDRARRLFLTGVLLDQFCQFKRDGKREIAEFRTRRRLGVYLLQFNAERLARSRANSVFELLLEVWQRHRRKGESITYRSLRRLFWPQMNADERGLDLRSSAFICGPNLLPFLRNAH